MGCSPWGVVLGIWYSGCGTRYLVLRVWYWYLVLRVWYSVFDTQGVILRLWYSGCGIRTVVLRVWYSDCGQGVVKYGPSCGTQGVVLGV